MRFSTSSPLQTLLKVLTMCTITTKRKALLWRRYGDNNKKLGNIEINFTRDRDIYVEF